MNTSQLSGVFLILLSFSLPLCNLSSELCLLIGLLYDSILFHQKLNRLLLSFHFLLIREHLHPILALLQLAHPISHLLSNTFDWHRDSSRVRSFILAARNTSNGPLALCKIASLRLSIDLTVAHCNLRSDC